MNGSCVIYYLILPNEEAPDWRYNCGFAAWIDVSSAYTDELNEILGLDKDVYGTTIATTDFYDDLDGWVNVHRPGISAGLCPLPSFDLGYLCGTSEIPDHSTGYNQTEYQYDFTLNNTEYP
jgi:hypothetical protein